MEFVSSLHNHCTLCDGANTPEEMVEAALAAGMKDFGFSSHGVDSLARPYSIKNEEEYAREIRALAAAYEDQINIWCGVEQDAIEPVQQRELFDYIIGSVHYVRTPHEGPFVAVDGDIYDIMWAKDNAFSGDIMAIVKDYYALEVWQAENLRPDVIGHFDIITRHNANNRFFDEESAEYRNIALEALDAVIDTDVVFEVNSAGLRKGLGHPYPSRFILERLCERKAPIIISTDCHDAKDMTAGVGEVSQLLQEVGFKQVLQWRGGSFVEADLA